MLYSKEKILKQKEISVISTIENEQTQYFITNIYKELHQIIRRCMLVMQGPAYRQITTAAFIRGEVIEKEKFLEYCALYENEKNGIIAVVQLDFDNRAFSLLRATDRWYTCRLETAIEAVEIAYYEESDRINIEQIFFERISIFLMPKVIEI